MQNIPTRFEDVNWHERFPFECNAKGSHIVWKCVALNGSLYHDCRSINTGLQRKINQDYNGKIIIRQASWIKQMPAYFLDLSYKGNPGTWRKDNPLSKPKPSKVTKGKKGKKSKLKKKRKTKNTSIGEITNKTSAKTKYQYSNWEQTLNNINYNSQPTQKRVVTPSRVVNFRQHDEKYEQSTSTNNSNSSIASVAPVSIAAAYSDGSPMGIAATVSPLSISPSINESSDINGMISDINHENNVVVSAAPVTPTYSSSIVVAAAPGNDYNVILPPLETAFASAGTDNSMANMRSPGVTAVGTDNTIDDVNNMNPSAAPSGSSLNPISVDLDDASNIMSDDNESVVEDVAVTTANSQSTNPFVTLNNNNNCAVNIINAQTSLNQYCTTGVITHESNHSKSNQNKSQSTNKKSSQLSVSDNVTIQQWKQSLLNDLKTVNDSCQNSLTPFINESIDKIKHEDADGLCSELWSKYKHILTQRKHGRCPNFYILGILVGYLYFVTGMHSKKGMVIIMQVACKSVVKQNMCLMHAIWCVRLAFHHQNKEMKQVEEALQKLNKFAIG